MSVNLLSLIDGIYECDNKLNDLRRSQAEVERVKIEIEEEIATTVDARDLPNAFKRDVATASLKSGSHWKKLDLRLEELTYEIRQVYADRMRLVRKFSVQNRTPVVEADDSTNL